MGRDEVAREATRPGIHAEQSLEPTGPASALIPLVPAKTSRPQMLRGRIRRQRLIDAVDVAVRSPVTVVCAGAGWGKSVLLSDWAASRRTGVAWLTLDDRDNDRQTLWSSVVAALRAAGAVPPDNPLAELRSVPIDDVERVRQLSRGLSMLRTATVLVLDDFQEISDCDVLRELLGLLCGPPHAMPIVIISRPEPELPLHRLRAAGKVADFRSPDLAFTAEEAAELLRKHDLAPTEEDVATLLERTEGWPAGLQFAAAFLAGADQPRSIAEFAGDTRGVDDYLSGEVLAGQSSRLHRFLLQTSICEHLCGDLADAVTLATDGQRTLEELERVNDFVVRLGAKPQWFRYHHLLRDVLRHRLPLEFPAIVPELHRRAAGWYAEHGGIIEALEHAAAAKDWAYLGHLLVTQAAPLVLSTKRASLIRIVQQVPPGLFGTVPELMVYAALLQLHAGDYDAIPARLDAARRLLRTRPDAERLPVEIALRSLQVAAVRAKGDLPALVDEATRLLAFLSRAHFAAVPAAAKYRAIALNDKGIGLLWTGRSDLGERYLWAASTAAHAAGVELVEINAMGHLALLETLSGSVEESRQLAATARDLADRCGWRYAPQTVAAHLAAALAHIERNETGQARQAIQQGRRAHQADPEAAQAMVLLGAQAWLALAVGDPAHAQSLLDQARRERHPRLRAPALERWLLLTESEVDLRTGRMERVEARYTRLALERDLTYPERVCRARAAFGMRDVDRAAELLPAPRLPLAETVANVEGRILAALIADATRHGLRAADALAEALALADQEGIRRPFVGMAGGRLDGLVSQQLLLSHRNAPFVTDILQEMNALGRRRPPMPAGDLSERETEVLHYLPTMLTAGEIAGQLGVSVNTVKAHLRSIYRKLASSRRQDAVSRARQLGLL
jgi:LuxR family transcriptional regulator, maltose regulon positive regulatory protein